MTLAGQGGGRDWSAASNFAPVPTLTSLQPRACTMPLFRLTEQIAFPHPDLAEENGLLAIGGDLSPARLLCAYRHGIFPWFGPGDPLLWWFISPRLVIFPEEFRVPGRLSRYRRKTAITITFDQAFAEVIGECARVREESGQGTWITPPMQQAFIRLHQLGYAHSVECRDGARLVGGLYGIALGQVFFGESMFSRTASSSQFALMALVDILRRKKFKLIDCQMTTQHLLRFGAREISGKEFQNLLNSHIDVLNPQKNWQDEETTPR